MRKLLAPGGPLGVFGKYPILLKFAIICVCAEMAWATLLIVMEFYFKEELLVEYSDQYIASKVAVAFLAFAGFETLFKYPMGTLADRYGPRPLVLLSLGICSITPLLMLAATKWFHVIPMRALDGFAAAALWPAMSALMARSVPREAKASAMSVFNGAYCLGLAIGPMAGLYLGHQLGSNRWVFPFCALIMFAGLLVAYSTLNAEAKRVASTSTATHMSELSIMPLLRRRPMLVRMMALYALSQVAVGILAPTVPIYIDSQFGIQQKDLAGLIVVPAILIVLIALPLGSAADKIGRARAVWISYAMAAVGMIMVATTSFFAPTRQLLAIPPMIFGAGILLLIMSYILGTPAWLGLTSLQVDDTRQAQALSLMQTSQGIGVVFAFAMVASAGHLMTQWNRVGAAIKHESVVASKSLDTVPLSVWFWVAALVFVLCLIGTLLWVRDTHHTAHEEELAQGAAQPLEITGLG